MKIEQVLSSNISLLLYILFLNQKMVKDSTSLLQSHLLFFFTSFAVG